MSRKGNAKLRSWISRYKQCLTFSHEIVFIGEKSEVYGLITTAMYVAHIAYKWPFLLRSKERINSFFFFLNMNFMFVVVFL